MTKLLIQELEKSWQRGTLPDIRVGDTVSVGWTIVEGKKKRVQKFEGIVIKMTGIRSRESITIRRIIDKVGVEKTFLLHSPLLAELVVVSKGKVRRAKLTYLRDRIGVKATRVKVRKNKAIVVPGVLEEISDPAVIAQEAGPEPVDA